MNYYIIGSKYDGREDFLPLMLEKGVIATGYNMHEDMQAFVGENPDTIKKYLKEKSEPPYSGRALKKFLNLKPGDLVAVKKHSSPSGKQARLVIGAYAIVKGMGSPVYKHCDDMGHTIEVDFIEEGLDHELSFGYGQTIHKVDDSERIKKIFGYYSNEVIKPDCKEQVGQLKNTDDVIVQATAGYISSRAHNKIQNLLVDELKEKYDLKCIKIEENHIDVLVELENKFILYEVKSSFSADRCIREALGQVIQYGHCLKVKSGKAVEYVVVGSSDVDDSENSYYTYVASILKEPFTYHQVSA